MDCPVLLEKPDDITIDENLGHGRVEKITCSIYSNLSHLPLEDNSWKGLKQFVKIESKILISQHKRLLIKSDIILQA